MKIAIIGFGVDAGQSALTFLKQQPEYKGAEFWVLDKNADANLPKKLSGKWLSKSDPRPSGLFPPGKPDFPLERPRHSSGKDRASRAEIPPESRWPTFQTASPGVFAQLGERYLDNLGRFDLIVRSPGIRYNAPEIQAAIKSGSTVTSATKLFLERCPAKNIIGVTGTKGKGTTSTLIYEILRRSHVLKNVRTGSGKPAKQNVFLAGNIGVPVLSVLPKLDKTSRVVLEMSSFQLMDVTQSPHIAVALMITSEHLDWHKDAKEYRAAKANIVRFQKPGDFAVLAGDYPVSRGYAKLTKAKTFFFSRRPKMPFRRASSDAFGRGTSVNDGFFWFSDGKKKEKICATGILQIPGEHNWENVGAAITVAKLLKIPNAAIVKTLSEFKGLEHRLEFVALKKGIRYYNDSYATTPETTIAAIQAFPNQPKILILGGSSKNSDFRELGRVISKSKDIKAIIGIGEEWRRIKTQIDHDYDDHHDTVEFIEDCKNMREIISSAKKIAAPGDVVLLSPACASFGMFKNYGDRGEQFKKWVKK